ncbi:EAL domain-containing protein [Bradyrhizobium sp.]|uniref:bifunctional diguanylate cyclase/phosphodiesterase n=1 Tax=Bradyrhizobium sp. TaxID=376 RepID=UPI00271CD0D2|nr:EAL domain-containing protein [Bradyrhizobium sp.]MDO9296482.1 EAL domain-containing protein [Bradyrhizobium sp.]
MSIRVRLLLLVLGTALLPAILVGWRYYEDRGKDIDAAISGLAATARSIATNLDTRIQGTSQLHVGLARARDLASPDKAVCSGFLSEVLAKHPQYTGILTIDPNGGLLCDSLRTGRVLDLRDRNYFRQASNAADSIVIEPVFGRLTGSAVLQIAYPVRDESQRLEFVLLASLDLTRFMKEQIENLPRGFEVLLADRNGTVLSRSPAPLGAGGPGASIADSAMFRVAADRGGSKELVNASGETQVWSASETLAVGGVNLHVMVGRSKSELVAAPNRRLAEDMAILGVLSLLLFAGVWLLAEVGIRVQISRIAAMAGRLGAGDLAARIPPPYPRGELGSLMRVLNGTAASLERQRHDIEDLNEKLRQSQSLEMLEKQRLDIALDNMTQGLVLFDRSERLIVCNQRYIEMYGLSRDVVKPGCTLRELIAHRRQTGSFKGDGEVYYATILDDVVQEKVTQLILPTADGRSVQVVNRTVAGGGWLATHEDITERARFDERIAHMAHYDALTDLPNRALFREQLAAALDGLAEGGQLAVLYIDIDEFKSVNDLLGHPIGDELLRAVAGRLRGCIAATDFVARLGGDECAIIQLAVERPADTTHLVERIYTAIREPYDCAGHLLTTDASIGIALAPQDGADLNELLKHADLAMYAAKADGRRTSRFFEPAMDARVKALRLLERDLRQAIAVGGLELHYQPLVDLANNAISGCEALLRWHHPTRGPISPAEFVPVAEETGLIIPLGEWVLAAACAEAATWPDHVRVAVNVSPVQFRSQALALKVAAALAVSGLPAHRLELEITEAVLIRDDEAALATLHQLRSLGVRIALDDFGTGYSSLSYLQRFPFDKIKIDRCFIKDIAEADGSACIVQAVVNIATARHMTTVAEGVETQAQRTMLRALGCNEMQGYLYSPALPATQIRLLLSSRGRVAGAA